MLVHVQTMAPRVIFKEVSESAIQASYLKWLALQYPKCYAVTFSIPNSGKRSGRFGKRLKREGMKHGVPDLFMAYPAGGYHGLFIEFKKEDGVLESDQITWIEKLENNDYKVRVCYNLESAISVTTIYLENK